MIGPGQSQDLLFRNKRLSTASVTCRLDRALWPRRRGASDGQQRPKESGGENRSGERFPRTFSECGGYPDPGNLFASFRSLLTTSETTSKGTSGVTSARPILRANTK